MRRDIPILTALPDEAVQMYFDTDGLQLSRVVVRVMNVELEPRLEA